MPELGIWPPNLLETIFDSIGVAVLVADVQRRIVYANDAAHQLFGVGRPLTNLGELPRNCRLIDARGREVPFERLGVFRALAGETVAPESIQVIFADGQRKWLHSSAHLFSVMGLSGVVLIAADDTRRMQLERAAAQGQRLEALGRLAGALAHRFNELLSVINLSALLVLDDPHTAGATRKKLEQIVSASRQAADLTKQLAQFSRAQELQTRTASINAVVQDVVSLMTPVVLGNVKLVTDLHPDLPDVDIDPAEMERALLNIALHARDAMPEGGVLTITTGVEGREIGQSLGEGGRKEFVAIKVSDTGPGIPNEIQDHIFEPFFTTKSKDNGTGMRLASAEGIVRQHNGIITVQSAAGGGTQFTICLPPSQSTYETHRPLR